MQRLPLEGIRVIDFTTVLAGPYMTEWMGVMGAEIIKIETNSRLSDRLALARSSKPRYVGVNESYSFALNNYSKKSITLNMKQPKAVELTKELVKISDIVTENFGGSVMDQWGLGYEELKQHKPDIILFSGSGYGRTGPRKEFPGYAPIVDAFTGLTSVNGYIDSKPVPLGSYGWTDMIQALNGTFAILAALNHRLETGEGQYIDAAMTESNANFMGELFMDYTMNDKVGKPVGNRDSIMAPHGCYRCQGDDKWVAIAVSSEQEWEAFKHAIGSPEWTKKEEFSDELSRWKNQEQLDNLIEEWTKKHDHYEVMKILQEAGVMAGVSVDMAEVVNDRQLNEREFFFDMEHPLMKKLHLARLPWKLSDTPRGNYYCAPLLGEHNDYVFGKLLGMPKEEVTQLEEQKVIY